MERDLAAGNSTPVKADQIARSSRVELKERTRLRLIEAALALIGQGRGYSSLSLREITREADEPIAAEWRLCDTVDTERAIVLRVTGHFHQCRAVLDDSIYDWVRGFVARSDESAVLRGDDADEIEYVAGRVELSLN